jgi:hypothetical protein
MGSGQYQCSFSFTVKFNLTSNLMVEEAVWHGWSCLIITGKMEAQYRMLLNEL